MIELRRVEREENGQFVQIAFADLKKGDRFKLYDDGVPGATEDGSVIYLALGDLFSMANGSMAPEHLRIEAVNADSPDLPKVA